jgi:hypothetical protein
MENFESDCYLEESSYLNIVNDTNDLMPSDDHVDLYNFQRNGSLPISRNCKRVDYLANILKNEGYSLTSLCIHCEIKLRNMIEVEYSMIQNQIRQYSLATSNSHKESDIDPSIWEKMVIGLNENSHLLDTEIESKKKALYEIQKQREYSYQDTNKEILNISNLEKQSKDLEVELYSEMNTVQSVMNECLFLSNKLFSSNPSFDLQILNPNIYLINGLRLSFEPITSQNLNWKEINMAWATIALNIVAIRNLFNMKNIILIPSGDRHIVNSIISISMQPLHYRVLFTIKKEKYVNKVMKSSTQHQPLHSPTQEIDDPVGESCCFLYQKEYNESIYLQGGDTKDGEINDKNNTTKD